MKISIVTLFPKMIKEFFDESIIKRAQKKGLVEIDIVNLRDFAIDSYGSVDDRPYGGGAGMVLRVDVIHKAISKIKDPASPKLLLRKASQRGEQRSKLQLKNQKEKIVLTSAKGKKFDQKKAVELAKLDHLILIAGHYEGIDERLLGYVDEEISLGDFVMTGGEIAAVAIVDTVVRLLPGVLKKEEATKEESFNLVAIDRLIESIGRRRILLALKKKGRGTIKLLEYPHYTRPEKHRGKAVPAILKCGDPKKISVWRLKAAFEETLKKRPELLK